MYVCMYTGRRAGGNVPLRSMKIRPPRSFSPTAFTKVYAPVVGNRRAPPRARAEETSERAREFGGFLIGFARYIFAPFATRSR